MFSQVHVFIAERCCSAQGTATVGQMLEHLKASSAAPSVDELNDMLR